jgi:uncharacterized protein YjbJ (UPF0337 family)
VVRPTSQHRRPRLIRIRSGTHLNNSEELNNPEERNRNAMSEKESGPQAGLSGIVEDVKGKAKEVVGAVTGNERLSDEGEAQQDKAAAERDVARKEAEAEKARAEADVAEARQRAAQES